ncbi:MAG: YafY family protein [Mycobacteriaceae bacterium]
MLSTSARLLRLLSLLQARSVCSGGDLAERLEVTPRSLRRDVERLRELGYPVEGARGVGGGYRLGAGRELPPLLLDDDEAVTVAVALQSAATGPLLEGGETALRALTKLEQVLPTRLRREVEALSVAVVLAGRREADTIAPDLLATLARACRDAERARFDYRSRDGQDSRRHVEPYRLVSTGRRWYLVAHDLERGAWRTFRVDRIITVRGTGARFARTEEPDAAAMVAKAVGATVYPCQATLRLHLSLAQARERYGAAQLLEPETATTCLLTAGADSWRAIAVYLLGTGTRFTVLGPDQMRHAVRDLAIELTGAG